MYMCAKNGSFGHRDQCTQSSDPSNALEATNLLLVSSRLVNSYDYQLKSQSFSMFDNFYVNYVLNEDNVWRFQVFLIIFEFLVAPAELGQNDDEGRGCPVDESSKIKDTSMMKQHLGGAKDDFSIKSWVCYHVAVVQKCSGFRRFDRNLKNGKTDANLSLTFNHLVNCDP